MKIIKDIKNYFYILKQIKIMCQDPGWSYLLLRNSGAKIYTVRTLRREDFGEENKTVFDQKLRELFEPVFSWLLPWNLQDVMIPAKIKQIDNSLSFLLVLEPKLEILNIRNLSILLFLILIVLFITLLNFFI